MFRLFYVLVLIHLSYGCWKRNKNDNADTTTVGPSMISTPAVKNNSAGGQDETDTTISTKAHANSTLPSKATSVSTDPTPVHKNNMKSTAADGLKKHGPGQADTSPNPPVNNYPTGVTTSSSIRSQLGLGFFAFSLAVVFCLF